MSHRHIPSRFRARPLLLAMALANGFSVLPAGAQPTGAHAIHGTATLSGQGANLVVTTQNGAGTRHSAINWQSFGIPAGSTTHFAQPDAASTSINRVLGGNPSAIFGTLSSNGRLVLVNPAGITVGAGAVVDTAGFTASTLRMTDADAIAGRLRFGDGSAAGPLRVDGRILAGSGDVVLIGTDVQAGTQAVIQSPQGATVLAAGQKVELTGRGLEGIRLEVQAPSDRAVNLGTLQGDAVGIFAGTLRHSGLIRASAATVQGGRVVLKAADHAETSGTVTAQGANGAGGQVDLLGRTVGVMAGGVIDTSNTAGGGQIRVGGDYLGGNPGVPNAQVTYVAADAQLRANATDRGDGGRVIVWADDTTRVHGSLQARGGAHGGDGGFVETSGKRHLDANGARVDASAAAGRAGQWLLDPSDLTISVAGVDTPGMSNPFTPAGINSVLTLATLQAALDGGTAVTLRTDGSGTGGTGNIVFDATAGMLDIVQTGAGAQTLTVDAFNDIVFTGGATSFRTQGGSGRDLSVVLQAGGGVHTETGAWVKLSTDHAASKVSAVVANGRTWTNDGNVTLNLNGRIDLSSGATFQNNGLLDGAAGSLGGIQGGNFVNWSDVRLTQGHFNVGSFGGGGSFRFDGNTFSAGSFDFSGTDLKIKALTGDVVLSGQYGINASGPVGLEAVAGDVEVMSGIAAGSVGVSAGGNITVHGYIDTYGGRTSLGGAGGGMVTLAAGGSVTVHGGIDTSGGYDYSGAAVGGAGGDIDVTAGSDISIGNIYAYGGSASGNGTGGNGAAINLSYGGKLDLGYVDAAGGGGGYDGQGTGGTGGRGGSLTIVRERGDLELSGLDLYLDGGWGGDGVVGGRGGQGGTLNLVARDGGVKVTQAFLSARGGDGGYSYGGATDAGGTGGQGGAIRISATGASQVLAWLDASGGDGGAGDYYGESRGGNGGNGGSIGIQVGGPLTLGGGLWAGGGIGGDLGSYEVAQATASPTDPTRVGADGALGTVYLAATGGITVPAAGAPIPTPGPTLGVQAATEIPPITGGSEFPASLQVDGALTNASSMKLESGAALMVSGPVTNNGAIDLGADATLAVGYTYDPLADSYTFGSGTLTNAAGALLTGSGTVQGSVLNAGTVAPGEGGVGRIGRLSITGNYEQTATGRLDMDVAANSTFLPGLTYDQLDIGGSMVMGGKLSVNAVPAVPTATATQLAAIPTGGTSTTPAATQFHELLKASAAGGSFDVVEGPADVRANIRMNINGTILDIPGNRLGGTPDGLLAAIAALLPGVALADVQQLLVESLNNASNDKDEGDKASGESDIVVTDASCKPAS